MWTGRRAEVGLRKSPVARDFRDDTSPTHRFAINGAPTLRDEWGTQAEYMFICPKCKKVIGVGVRKAAWIN